MDKCFSFTILLLVYHVAAVGSQDVYKCKFSDSEKMPTGYPDLWLNVSSNTICKSMSTVSSLCNVINIRNKTTIVCDIKGIPCPGPCADAVTVVPGCAMPNTTPHCKLPSSNMAILSPWSNCIMSGEWYRHRSLVCQNNQSECLILSNGSSFEISNCTIESATSSTAKENLKEAEKQYTLTEIILVAMGCFLLGAILSALLFLFHIKRIQQRCFSKHTNDAQSNSNQQSGPDLKFLTESVVKKYEGNKPKSSHSNKENIAEETYYQSLESNQVSNDQQTYDKLKAKESRSGPQGFHADPSSPKQSGDFVQTHHTTNLQNKTEGAHEYSRDCEEHNYFILEGKALHEKIIPGMWNVQKPGAVVREEANCTTLETEDNQYDAAHEYFVLEHLENRQNQAEAK